MTTSTCKSTICAAPILWRTSTVTGKWICLDSTPTPSDDRFVTSRKFHYTLNPDGETCTPCSLEDWQDHETSFFISHWRTCRDVTRWSKSNPNGSSYSRPNISAESAA